MIFRRVYRLVFELSHAEQLAQWCEYRARLQGLSPRCRAVGIAACIRIVCGLCDAVQSTCSLPLRYQESTPARRADVPACFALSAWFLSGSSNACNSKQPVRHLPATAERACSAQVRCRTLRASRSPVAPNQSNGLTSILILTLISKGAYMSSSSNHILTPVTSRRCHRMQVHDGVEDILRCPWKYAAGARSKADLQSRGTSYSCCRCTQFLIAPK